MSTCPRCGQGIDHDGDGNCGFCAQLSRVKVTFTKEFWIKKGQNDKEEFDQKTVGIGRMYKNAYGMTVEKVEEID